MKAKPRTSTLKQPGTTNSVNPAAHSPATGRSYTTAQAPKEPLEKLREWLEGPDRPLARVAALAVAFVCLAYLTFHLILLACRGG